MVAAYVGMSIAARLTPICLATVKRRLLYAGITTGIARIRLVYPDGLPYTTNFVGLCSSHASPCS